MGDINGISRDYKILKASLVTMTVGIRALNALFARLQSAI